MNTFIHREAESLNDVLMQKEFNPIAFMAELLDTLVTAPP